jgi:hypothetical protein
MDSNAGRETECCSVETDETALNRLDNYRLGGLELNRTQSLPAIGMLIPSVRSEAHVGRNADESKNVRLEVRKIVWDQCQTSSCEKSMWSG